MPARCLMCDNPLPDDGDAQKYRPFCSERCRLVDLSKWLGEEYRVPGPALEGSRSAAFARADGGPGRLDPDDDDPEA